MQLATGYWPSAALLAANQLGIFQALDGNPASASDLARQFDIPIRSVTMLLDACAALGLLDKQMSGETKNEFASYSNSDSAAAFLVPGRPGYLGDAIRWSADQYALWGDLANAVRANAPLIPPPHLGHDPDKTRTFVLGMHNRALGVARGVVPFLDFGGASTLLDVGGGPGTYAQLLAQNYADLRITLLDLPEIVEIARELIADAKMGDRIITRSGNAVTDSYGTAEFDAVLFSGVLHQMGPAIIQSMLAKAHKALKPGGRVLISDVMVTGNGTEPAFGALFSLQMLLTSEAGGVFSVEQAEGWLGDAGFHTIVTNRLPPPLPYFILTGMA